MNTLASTIELGAHPATALLLGGIAAAVLRGNMQRLYSFFLLFLVCFMFTEWRLGLFQILTFLGMKF